MKLVAGLAILSLTFTACTSEGSEPGRGRDVDGPPSPLISSTLVTTPPTTNALTTTVAEASPTSTSQTSEQIVFDWPAGTVTCAEIEGNFPSGVDDHGIYLDKGLVSYYRAGEEVFIQFLDDPTCTVDTEVWMFMIRPLLEAGSLSVAGGLCDFYRSVQEADPPPANLEVVLEHLADAEQLCS